MKTILFIVLVSTTLVFASINPPRSYDGKNNNPFFSNWGSAHQIFDRGREGVEYAPGNQPRPGPNARSISNAIGRGDDTLRDRQNHTMMALLFGQFINHDFEENAFLHPDERIFTLNVTVDELDDEYCWGPSGDYRCNPGDPTLWVLARDSDGVIIDGHKEIINHATSYLDLNHVYGKDENTVNILRTHVEGKMLLEDYSLVYKGQPYSFKDFIPSYNTTGLPIDTAWWGFNPTQITTQGDVRAGENAQLASIHTMFTRLHNLYADWYKQQQPNADDETLFQLSRRLTIAVYQKIVFDYIRSEFGEYAIEQLGPYTGYKPFSKADTLNIFSTAAFRYGHSSLVEYDPLDQCGVPHPIQFMGRVGGPFSQAIQISLAGGPENMFRGMSVATTAHVDTMFQWSIRSSIKGGTGGTDLYTLDIIRGRANGIPNYERVRSVWHDKQNRRIYGSPGCSFIHSLLPTPDPIECFNRITTNQTTASQLKDLYGKVNKIDAYVGMLAEPHIPGTSFGSTLMNIVIEQYSRARDHDRYWFENVPFMQWTSDEWDIITTTTFGSAARQVFDLEENFPDNPFLNHGDYMPTCE